MRTYISGRISGIDLNEAKEKFSSSKEFLNSIGMEAVNPMENGLPSSASWDEHMVRDIEMLLACDAIYMQADWVDSRGARIEKHIAEQTSKMVIYESVMYQEHAKIVRIKEAIEYATGLKFKAYTTSSRHRGGYFARMIFTKHCIDCDEFTDKDVSVFVNRNLTNVRRYLNNYDIEIKINKKFKNIARKVDNYLTNNVSH